MADLWGRGFVFHGCFLLLQKDSVCAAHERDSLGGSPGMWGARSGSARSRANGNTFWGKRSVKNGFVLFTACGR